LYAVRLMLTGLVLALLLGLPAEVQAQSEEDIWGPPVNLSRSGAASQPRLVAAPDGRLQAFWWDRFDGLVTTVFNDATWSSSVKAPIMMTVEIENPGPGEEPTIVVPAVSEMPVIVSDNTGWVHALWLRAPDEKTGAQALMHSQMRLGSASWSEPEVLAESAVAFDMSGGASGRLVLAYVRTLHTETQPAGIYVRRNLGRGGGWEAATTVYGSIYFRLLTPEEAYVRVADGFDKNISVVWEDPRLEEARYARSIDAGITWTEPVSLGDADQGPGRPRIVALPNGGALRLWEGTLMSDCNLYQQRYPDPNERLDAWGPVERVLQGVSRCPEEDRFWLQGNSLVWLWGEGSRTLSLAAWDAAKGQWSEPRLFDFGFEDPETARQIDLEDLRVAFGGQVLTVLGSDPAGGEVWATVARMDALELAFAPIPPWSEPELLSQEGAQADTAAMALDAEGGIRVVWSEQGSGKEPGAVVLYAQRSGADERWSYPVEVARGASGEELARQPALVTDARGLVHVVWSGGTSGHILYSRAQTDQARIAREWSSPQTLSDPGMAGSWPQIGIDGAGRLYVVYAVPLNEGRGIYAVRSDDGGLTWSDPGLIFDAQEAGWALVDHPTMAVAHDGTVHVAWIRAALSDSLPPQGIYYARVGTQAGWGGSTIVSDSGEEGQPPAIRLATEQLELADAGHDWPQLVLAGGDLRLIYNDAEGGVWHRRYEMGSEAEAGFWDTPRQVTGLPQVSGPVGLAADGGGTLHLVGVAADGEELLYSTWDGERWSSAEAFTLEPGMEAESVTAAATADGGGELAVALSVMVADEGEEATLALYFTARTIPTVDVSVMPTPLPLPSATPELAAGELEPTLGVPTLTPDLMAGPTPSSSAVDPRLLGGGMAAVILVGALVMWPLLSRRR
jgi:hypothetical protein